MEFKKISKEQLSQVLDQIISTDNFYSIAADLIEQKLINNQDSEFYQIIDLIWDRLIETV